MQKTLRRRAELASANADDDAVAAWLKRHPPLSGFGKVRAAEIVLNRGKTEAGTAALRTAWIEGDFGRSTSAACWRAMRHGCVRKTTRTGSTGCSGKARPMPPGACCRWSRRITGRLRKRAGPRRRLRQCRPNWSPRSRKRCAPTPGWPSSRRAGGARRTRYDTAAELLLGISAIRRIRQRIGSERLVVARRLLASGNAATAYQLVHQHARSTTRNIPRRSSCAGYIALRFRKEPGPRSTISPILWPG